MLKYTENRRMSICQNIYKNTKMSFLFKKNEEIKTSYSVYTNIGSREINEDAIGAYERDGKYCFILCDGLGGHGMGEVASRLVVEVFENRFNCTEYFFSDLSDTFRAAQQILIAEQNVQRANSKMKTTAVFCGVDGKRIHIGHVGDSRVYVFKDNRIVKRTLDHSIPQMLAISGEINDSEIRNHPDRNVILRVLGVEWENDMFELMSPILIKKVQAVLLCSDGFWELITESDMERHLANSSNVNEWVEKMSKKVLENGKGKAMDNNSAIGVWFR